MFLIFSDVDLFVSGVDVTVSGVDVTVSGGDVTVSGVSVSTFSYKPYVSIKVYRNTCVYIWKSAKGGFFWVQKLVVLFWQS